MKKGKMGSEDERRRSHGLKGPWGIFFLFFGLLVVYPLSIGPAAKLVEKRLIPKSAFHAFYSPLLSILYPWPPATRFFRWYVKDFWNVKSGAL